MLAPPDDGVAARAQVIHQVGIALAQGGDGRVFGVALAPLEPLKDQHPVALVLGDALADRLQGLAQGAGALALALPGVDLDAIKAALALMGAHLGVQVGELHQLQRGATTGADHFHALRLGGQGAADLIGVEQAQVEHRIELVEHHHRIKVAGDRPLGDVPAPLGLLAVKFGGFFGREVIAAPGAHLIDQVGEALL